MLVKVTGVIAALDTVEFGFAWTSGRVSIKLVRWF